MQALILAGGEGTRLRPLTSTMPKPVVPLVDRPFIAYMLEWLRGHGVDDAIISCGFMANAVQAVLGDGRELGMRVRYVEEPRPLGTAGAVKFAHELLEERFLVLNGDVLTDIDLSAQLAQHERTGARATLALIAVDDPSAYGLVRLQADNSVAEFVEKPQPGQIDTNVINAGAYVLERDVLDEIGPPGSAVSIEREVFPKLVGAGLFGCVASGYWLDIGTPERYLRGTYDILENKVSTEAGGRFKPGGAAITDGAQIEGKVIAPSLVGAGSVVASGATIGARSILGRGVSVDEGTSVEAAVVLDQARIGADCRVGSSIIGHSVVIGDRCVLEEDVVLGEGARIGSDNVLSPGARIFPGVHLPDQAIKR